MLITQTIDDALVEIGVINPIESASPQDHKFGLRTLNRIIDSYNIQNLTIPYIQDIAFKTVIPEPAVIHGNDLVLHGGLFVIHAEINDNPDLPRFTKAYIDIGVGEEWNSTAPVDIQGLYWRQEGTDYPSKPMAINQWESIPVKETEAIPSYHYVQKMDGNKLRIYFDRIPIFGLELHLLAKMPYTGVNGEGDDYVPTDDIKWTRGFEKMLMLRLAVELCSSYSVQPSQDLIARGQEAEDNLKSANATPRTLRTTLHGKRRRFKSNSNRARY